MVKPTKSTDTIKVLIVEDNALFALEVEMLIFNLGYEVLKVVNNSEDALATIAFNPPDLIIMDVDIEGNLNGIEVAEKISHRQIPVLFVTSMRDKNLYEKAKKTSLVGYLIKPFDEISLQSAIEFGLSSLHQKNIGQQQFKGWKEDFIYKEKLLIKQGSQLRKLNIRDILVGTAKGNYCDIQTLTEKHVINLSLTKFLQMLPEGEFIRIHKKHIVQVKHISNIILSDSMVEINGKQFPIGRAFKDALLKQFKIL